MEPSSAVQPPSKRQKLWLFWLKYWFLFGLAFAIGLAAAYPPLPSLLRSDITVSYVVVALIFLLSGLSLKSRVLVDAALSWRITLFIQVFSLLLCPLFGFGLVKLLLLIDGFSLDLAIGLAVALATPTTISSNVLMTKQCGGNESASLVSSPCSFTFLQVNAVVGNVIGVFVSPSIIFLILRNISPDAQFGMTPTIVSHKASISYSNVFLKLGITVIAPLVLGTPFLN